jgi:ABC-type sugar transport system ATPase subunit
MQEMTTVDPLAVAIEGVSHCYRRQQALDDVTSITPSTFVVLLGLNGAGKSTLMSLITRLYAIQRGHIRVFGRDVGHASSEALRMVGVAIMQPCSVAVVGGCTALFMVGASLAYDPARGFLARRGEPGGGT